jgi:hypothetical protein
VSAQPDPSDRIVEILRELIALSADNEELALSSESREDKFATSEEGEFTGEKDVENGV